MELIVLAKLIVLIIGSYILGSISFAMIISKKAKDIDITKVGSGNPGTTNTFRVLGWKLSLLNLVLDTLRGLGAITLVNILFDGPLFVYYIIAGGLAILGSVRYFWTKFKKGGKGVSTSLGVLLGLLPGWFIILIIIIFVLVVWLSRYVSLGSISAALAAVITKLLLLGGFNKSNWESTTFVCCIFVIIVFFHRVNIEKILNGTENKITFKKPHPV